jgi:hypothetical protein
MAVAEPVPQAIPATAAPAAPLSVSLPEKKKAHEMATVAIVRGMKREEYTVIQDEK